ncbi:MAG: hypothetical protein LBJ14_02590 [Desulfarculales bacterium]|jgi:hypothetical protein|nr:hypothetical protein [Desulfarculales bacterium]
MASGTVNRLRRARKRHSLPAIFLSSFLAGGVLLSSAPAGAEDSSQQELSDIFARSQQYYSQSRPEQALELLEQALQIIWNRVPLNIGQAHILASPPLAAGQYQPRREARLRPQEPLALYMQPQGFKVRRQEGMFLYSLSTDFKLSDAWGRVVREQKDFSSFSGSEFSFPSRLPIVIIYNFSGLSPGNYRLETTLRDLYGQQKAVWATSFSIQP